MRVFHITEDGKSGNLVVLPLKYEYGKNMHSKRLEIEKGVNEYWTERCFTIDDVDDVVKNELIILISKYN